MRDKRDCGVQSRFVCVWRDLSRFKWRKTQHRARFSCPFPLRMAQNLTSCTMQSRTPSTFAPSARTPPHVLRQAPAHPHGFCATRPPESPPSRTRPTLLRHLPAHHLVFCTPDVNHSASSGTKPRVVHGFRAHSRFGWYKTPHRVRCNRTRPTLLRHMSAHHPAFCARHTHMPMRFVPRGCPNHLITAHAPHLCAIRPFTTSCFAPGACAPVCIRGRSDISWGIYVVCNRATKCRFKTNMQTDAAVLKSKCSLCF